MNYSGYTYIYAAFGGSSDATTLQLTDNTGLASLNAQDAVVQNSGGTPVTSAITNVLNTTASNTGPITGTSTDGITLELQQATPLTIRMEYLLEQLLTFQRRLSQLFLIKDN